jgi:hypothetical protein
MSGTHEHPFFITESDFRAAIDSLVGFATGTKGLVGFMGGDPILHPQFVEFCDYAVSKIPREKLGLWSTFPSGKKFFGYREAIVRTFGNVLLNDHSRDDIFHAPVLMAAEDHFDNDEELFAATEHCWVQESWSPSINPKGAWFCEVAGALSDLFNGPEGWKVEPGWWKRTTKDFTSQREWACRKCGAALPIARIRNSQDSRDDVSKSNLERLKEAKSRKVARGEYVLHDEFKFDVKLMEQGTYPVQSYKDWEYRQGIAQRYGIWLSLNDRGYMEPHLMTDGWRPKPNLYQIMQAEAKEAVHAG